MDEDDWRGWKNGKHDNRYHGVKRHSGQRGYKTPVIVSVIVAVVFLSYFVFQTYGTPEAIKNEANKAIQNTGNTIQQITSQSQQSFSNLQTTVKSSTNQDTRVPIAVYNKCSSYIRNDLKTIETSCFLPNAAQKSFKFVIPQQISQSLQPMEAMLGVKTTIYQYSPTDFKIGLYDQVGEKNYTVTLWQLPH